MSEPKVRPTNRIFRHNGFSGVSRETRSDCETTGLGIKMPEKIYLVGAGPGDPELLTRKAWRVLQSADVVLHDDLVSEGILRAIPPSAQIVNVGKRCGAKGISQAEINDLMISLATENKIVVRLKSGDPLLFGRAGEEMQALRAAGIEFEIIPGVTSALGAAASAKISLTDRRHASRVVFVTAHREGGSGLVHEHDVAADTTYVIYMPGSRYAALALELQAAGIGAETPCLVISRATTKGEKLFRTTVGKLSDCPAVESPSLLIVGLVVGVGVGVTVGNEIAEGEVPGKVRPELLSLIQQHPLHNSFGGSSGE
jgi:uroporphyrin-III C-methyltransferase